MKMTWCVASFMVLIFCAGVRLHGQQIDTNSIESIKIKAENGEARSQTVLALIYEYGLRGATKDSAEALKWFSKAAEQSFAPAQYGMGTCCANGLGVAKDNAEAVKWYLKAANQNLAVAQYNLGVGYRDGVGVAKDEEEAAIWFRKAADQNLAIAQYNLGVCYDNGQGVGKDSLKAVKWYSKAADQNLAYAQCNLGAHYEHGVGVAEDRVEAVKLYRKGAEQNYALAQYNLAVCYANGQGVAQDAVEAVKWYRLAAEQNNALAQCNLGICYANGQGVGVDAAEAAKWFRKAANQNDSEAQYNLGVYYYYGKGVAQNNTEAYIWFSLSATQGDVDASQSRNILASHLSHEEIAAAQKRIASFVPRKDNAEDNGLKSITSTTFLNQQADLTNESIPLQTNPSKADTGTPQTAIGHNYFTVGSTRDEVLAIQGEPTTFNDNYLTYGMSMVMFRDGKVANWNNVDVKLKARYLTATNLIPKDYFTVGSTRDDVLAIEGEPTTFNDNYLTYGMSMVMFQDGKVANWNNVDVKLKARYLTATNLVPKDYFTVGSTRDDVLAIEGEPTTFNDNYLTYGMSMVMFQDGKVANWNIVDVKLKARYLTATNFATEQQPLEINANPVPTQQPTIFSPLPLPVASPQPQGFSPDNVSVQAPDQPQINGIAFMDSFLGTTNFCVPSDNVISMKPDALQFQINGKTYDYSGHYAVMLRTPRKHKNPMFGFGTPDKAKLIIIDDFNGEAMPLPDATIWEKSNGFIDVEALGKEWIYSGTYTIQN
jgi:hypothetical protein